MFISSNIQRLERQRPFLESILIKQAKPHEREHRLDHANKDQINAVTELVLNFLKRHIPTSPHVVRQLSPHKNVLRALARRRNSAKQRRELLKAQTGGSFWKHEKKKFSPGGV